LFEPSNLDNPEVDEEMQEEDFDDPLPPLSPSEDEFECEPSVNGNITKPITKVSDKEPVNSSKNTTENPC